METARRSTLVAILCTVAMIAWLAAVPALAQERASDDRPSHAGETGPPDHAGEQGRPDHAGEQGRPDHAGEQGRPDHAERRSEEGPPPSHARAYGHDRERGEAQPTRTQSDGAVASEAGSQGDPNRGSVKVRDAGYDGSPRHEPHVGCEFTIVFLGFDEDEARDFWLYVHPPTAEDGPGETLAYPGTVALDGARGNELSAEYGPITVDDLDGLTADNRHDQQGWKLKLTVDGPKHKVFWIDCDTPIEGDVAGMGGAGELGSQDGETDAVGGFEQGADAQTRTSGVSSDGGLDDQEAIFGLGGGWDEGSDDAAVVAAGGPDGSSAEVFGVGGGSFDGETLGSTGGIGALPVTGGDLLLLLALGLGLAAVGTGILRLRRDTT